MIEFLCPNEHRIRCQAEQAGRAAKCPRCGVKFRIPQPTDRNVSEVGSSDSNFSRPEFIESTGSSRKLPSTGGAAPKEPQIEFLCPNGHRLHGAASLQGRPGECPECGSRFRIPTYGDVSADEDMEKEISLGRIDGQGSDAGRGNVTHASLPLSGEFSTASATNNIPGQGMADLVARLWDIHPDGAKVELRFRDGETIVLHQFLKKLSQETRQGVFAVQEENGNVSLVVVAWDTVARVALRGLGEVPQGLAD